MRVLGVDYGRRRIGLAISDETETLATPLDVWCRARTIRQDMAFFRSLVSKRSIDWIVVGLPYHMNGSAGEMVREVEEFVSQLRKTLQKPVSTIDERESSQIAQQRMIEGGVRKSRRRTMRDSAAAAVILQTFLDRRRTSTDQKVADATTLSSLPAADTPESLRRPDS